MVIPRITPRERTPTQSLRPSKLSARPRRPLTCLGPWRVPSWRAPELSAAVRPERSSKFQAPTSFGATTGGGLRTIEGGSSSAIGAGLANGVGLGLGDGVGFGLGEAL